MVVHEVHEGLLEVCDGVRVPRPAFAIAVGETREDWVLVLFQRRQVRVLHLHLGAEPDHEAHEGGWQQDFKDGACGRASPENQVFAVQSLEMATKLGHAVVICVGLDR